MARFGTHLPNAGFLLNSILEAGNQRELRLPCIRTKAFEGMLKVAEQADLNRTPIYRTLPNQGDPEKRSLMAFRNDDSWKARDAADTEVEVSGLTLR